MYSSGLDQVQFKQELIGGFAHPEKTVDILISIVQSTFVRSTFVLSTHLIKKEVHG